MTDLVLRGRRVVTGDGERPAALAVTAGRITDVLPHDAAVVAAQEVAYGEDVVLLPGLVDTHVHLQDPGTDWEGFGPGTRAAAAGGVTTVVDMPVDSVPPTVDVPAVEAKRAAARGRCHVDVGFWAGATADNLGLLPALAGAGVLGAKAFLVDPGVPGFTALPVGLLPAAGRVLARLGLPLLVHAEMPGPGAAGPCPRYADHLAAHPARRETDAVEAVVAAARESGCRMHAVHVTTARAAATIGAARRAGVPVSGETCPHLLAFAAQDVPDGATEYAVGPPLRDRANALALWDALVAGDLDLVVSDHSPAAPGPGGDFATTAPGIAGVELGLPVVWSLARERGVPLPTVARWMSAAPAAFAGLGAKGALAPGRDADVAVLDPDATFVVTPESLRTRRSRTPYAGRTLHGVVRATWLRGRLVDDTPAGRLLAAAGRSPACASSS